MNELLTNRRDRTCMKDDDIIDPLRLQHVDLLQHNVGVQDQVVRELADTNQSINQMFGVGPWF